MIKNFIQILGGIVSYMRSQAGPASSDIDSEAKWTKVSANSEALIVGFFDDYTSGNGQVFMKVSLKNNNL